MRSARILTVLALAAGLGLSACGSSGSPHVSVRSNQSRAVSAGDRYVAIGDSYTGAPYTADSTADDGCVQSSENYPHQVARTLGLSLVDVSCGGAQTSAVTGSQTTSTGHKKPPQLDAVTASTALVTVSLGGNDGNVFAAASSGCLALTRTGSGQSCAEVDHAAGDRGTASKIDAMEQHLEKALAAIIERAPHARVLVVGYPDVMPSRSCAQYPLAQADIAWVGRINQELVGAQRRAAHAVGAEFVDVYAATRGHDICSADPWEAGLQPTAAAAPFHPYATEQLAVATAIEKQLAGSPAP
jgi:lysophospholipase L1-like esterase